MKKFFAPVFSLGIAALMASTFVSCNSGNTGTTTVNSSDSLGQNTAAKIVYVNADSLFEHYEYLYRYLRNLPLYYS